MTIAMRKRPASEECISGVQRGMQSYRQQILLLLLLMQSTIAFAAEMLKCWYWSRLRNFASTALQRSCLRTLACVLTILNCRLAVIQLSTVHRTQLDALQYVLSRPSEQWTNSPSQIIDLVDRTTCLILCGNWNSTSDAQMSRHCKLRNSVRGHSIFQR